MPIAVSPNAQSDVAATIFGKNGLHYAAIFGNESKDNPAFCGLLTVSKTPEKNMFTQPCSVFVIVLEGELDLQEEAKPGELNILKAGDVVRIDKGTVISWTSPTYGKAFFSAETSGEDLNLHDHLV